MLAILVLLAAAGAMIALSVRANRRFRTIDRLPMQWTLTGAVSWRAPRAVALAFTPVLGTFVIMLTGAMPLWVPPRAGQEGLVIPVLMAMAAGFVAIHALHIWMIGRWSKRR
ncbi:hypothetical protein PMI04_007745 [Sphingobium sp. AP49]|uniref:hypothetical protein n=1 Tax=Sphingobium sp. AP49 TaxID=1144307 RepID=UPI00026EDDC0|nr:hypothetical protein [Sphingobium sp. AP49]WHO40478.1 hypothetical protein PMI04_007745 [Sphingobium sp. AP49]